jgi:nucleotide-binding universal stress UspA family protein
MDGQGLKVMDTAEPPPLPGQPRRHRATGREGEQRDGLAAAGELGHPVVAGYDGSPSSRNALAYAAGLSGRLGRPLLVVHVSPPGIYCEPLTGQVIGCLRDPAETERWLLAELAEVCGPAGTNVSVVTRRGNPARELAAAAREYGADALVIGAPGQRWHHMAGSVSGWLARHAQCPVVVVP